MNIGNGLKIATVAQVMEKLKLNEYKCALTGWTLEPDNFALDHVQALADGGSDLIDNLECVHPLGNRAKGTMGKAQFVDMCIAVANHASSSLKKSTVGAPLDSVPLERDLA